MSIAGALRERVTLQSFSATNTDAGDQAETWMDVITDISARMQPKKMSEYTRAMRPASEARYVATIRNRPGVAAQMRLIWGTRTFTVEGVLNLDERGHFLALDCSEIVV